METTSRTNDPLRLYDQEWAGKLHDEMELKFPPLIGTANQLAANAFYDTYDLLVERGLVRQALKTPVNKTASDWERYQSASKRYFGDRWYLLQDVVTIATNDLAGDTFKLGMSIKQVMDKHRIKDSDICSSVHLTQTLLDIAVGYYDVFVGRYQSKTCLDITKDISFVRLGDMQKRFMPVTRHFSHCNGIVDLNTDPTIRLGVKILTKYIMDGDIINEAARKAMHLNPDMAKYAKEEHKHYFQ